jgi:hypothetical protein
VEEAAERLALLGAERREDVVLDRRLGLLSAFERIESGRRDRDEVTAAIGRIPPALDSFGLLELIKDQHARVGVRAQRLGEGLLGDLPVVPQVREDGEVLERETEQAFRAAAVDDPRQPGQQHDRAGIRMLAHARRLYHVRREYLSCWIITISGWSLLKYSVG